MLVLKRTNVIHDSSYLFWENIECVTSLNHPLIVIKIKDKINYNHLRISIGNRMNASVVIDLQLQYQLFRVV